MISILMPVKNRADYIEHTLRSISEQVGVEYQLLVYDNGSTDGTREILSHWIPSIIPGVVITDNPLPYALSLSKLVSLAEYEYIARIDSDDVMMPDRLRLQYEYMTDNPDVGLLGSLMYSMDARGVILGKYADLPIDHASLMLRFLRLQNPIPHPSVMMRKTVVLAAGNYRDVHAIDDMDLWLRMLRLTKASLLPQELTVYRFHQTSVTALSDPADIRGKVIDLVSSYSELYGLEMLPLRNILMGRSFLSMVMIAKVFRTLYSCTKMTSSQEKDAYESLRGLIGQRDYVTKTFLLLKCPSVLLQKVLVVLPSKDIAGPV
jgi:glycosyltransferase involved in cell wall biosynthesis